LSVAVAPGLLSLNVIICSIPYDQPVATQSNVGSILSIRVTSAKISPVLPAKSSNVNKNVLSSVNIYQV
jgi:hypothetical protein